MVEVSLSGSQVQKWPVVVMGIERSETESLKVSAVSVRPSQAALYQWLSGHQIYFGLRIYAKIPILPNISVNFPAFAS